MRPVRLPPNPLRRTYRGSGAITRFRGTRGDEEAPEDWVGSTTTAFGDAELGLSRLETGLLLRDAIAAEPEGFLGPGRSEPGLLVKLLDAGQRLPVHIHPDRAFARERLGSPYGKTEAWAIVETHGDAAIWLGFRDHVDETALASWVSTQDAPAMLEALHELRVAPGDVVFVPAGAPHAIGAGILMVELQEPTDLSILLEWQGYAVGGEDEAHLGLGWETALGAVDRSAWPLERLARTVSRVGDGERVPLLPAAAAPFFGGERLRPAPRLELEPSFAILVVLAGSGRLEGVGGELALVRGDTVVVPYGAGATVLSGALDAIRCLPPAQPA